MTSSAPWPPIAGGYQVGDPQAPVAVCALTSEDLIAPLARLAGVAIAGKVYTANLGIERIVVNVTANPAIRFLLLCGKDSPLFHPGQSLVALTESGLDDHLQIVGALGYEPYLRTLAPDTVARFRRQVEVVDWTGEEDLTALEQGITGLAARNPGPFAAADQSVGIASLVSASAYEERFISIRPGGQREPLQYDPKGYFVITLDREREEILLRHYLPDHTPAHEMRGRAAGPMLLGLLREGLVSQLSHAGYLGEELAKAQAALRLGLRYDQDRPLRPRETAAPPAESASAPSMPASDADAPAAPAMPATPAMPRMPQITQPMSWAQVEAAAPDAQLDVALAVSELPAPDLLAGTFLECDEADPFSTFRRTAHPLRLRWTPSTQIVMGDASDLQAGALVRARGPRVAGDLVDAQRLVILTRVAHILDG